MGTIQRFMSRISKYTWLTHEGGNCIPEKGGTATILTNRDESHQDHTKGRKQTIDDFGCGSCLLHCIGMQKLSKTWLIDI